MKRLLKNLELLFYLLCALALAWFIVSWIDVAAHNISTESYWQYNLFAMIFGA